VEVFCVRQSVFRFTQQIEMTQEDTKPEVDEEEGWIA
jgi:flagellar biosynthesis protein FlhB